MLLSICLTFECESVEALLCTPFLNKNLSHFFAI